MDRQPQGGCEMTPATKLCDKCAGDGTVPRTRRILADGVTVDPLDSRGRELCDKCGGSGSVLERPTSVGRTPGYLVDMPDVRK